MGFVSKLQIPWWCYMKPERKILGWSVETPLQENFQRTILYSHSVSYLVLLSSVVSHKILFQPANLNQGAVLVMYVMIIKILVTLNLQYFSVQKRPEKAKMFVINFVATCSDNREGGTNPFTSVMWNPSMGPFHILLVYCQHFQSSVLNTYQ